MIYTLNARDNIKLQLFKRALELSTKEILGLINEDFNVTESVLSEKGILYKDLRNVLTPLIWNTKLRAVWSIKQTYYFH